MPTQVRLTGLNKKSKEAVPPEEKLDPVEWFLSF
jgi:hypothetical protein